MRIVFAIKSLTSAGGAERVFVEVAAGLVRRGHLVSVVSYDSGDAVPFYCLDAGVHWVRVQVGPADQPSKLFTTLKRMGALRRRVAALDPDIAVGFMTSMYIPLGCALAGTRIPLLASEHTSRARYASRRFEGALLGLMPWLCEALLVVSNEVRDSYPARLRRHMTVVPNPVEVKIAGRVRKAQPDDRKTLLSVGRLVKSKNYRTLVEAFSLIADQTADWDLRIVGEGPLRADLEGQISKLGLKDRIHLPGLTKDISAEYAGAQLFVLPSRYESLSLVTLEALSHGLPAVGFSDCDGVNSLIVDGYNGILVGGRNRTLALSATLSALMNSSEARLAISDKPFHIPPEFQLERVLDRWETILSQYAKPRPWKDDIKVYEARS